MMTIKSALEIERMKDAGKILGSLLNEIESKIFPGISTKMLDKFAEEYIIENRALPSFKGVPGIYGAKPFPASICTSVNDEIIHGIPSGRILEEGDIVSIDAGVSFRGYQADACRTFTVGKCSEEALRLIAVTKQSFFEGVKKAVPNNRIIDVSGAIQDYVEGNGYSLVKEYTGHGIGRELHEDPEVPNYRGRIRGPRLQPGVAIAIEPMVCAGSDKIVVDSRNKWTVSTADGKLSAHYENTVIVTDGEAFITTLL